MALTRSWDFKGRRNMQGYRASFHGRLVLPRTALGKYVRESIAVGDLVNVSCKRGVWTVVGARVRNLEPKFQVQLGDDPSTVHWVQSDVVTLMQKASTASH